MQDLDALFKRESQFKLKGEIFTFDDVSPEILSTFEPAKNGKKEPDVWSVLDQQILLFIVPEDHERWKKLRARQDKPVTIGEITYLLEWLMEQETQRPTTAPSA